MSPRWFNVGRTSYAIGYDTPDVSEINNQLTDCKTLVFDYSAPIIRVRITLIVA